MDSITSNLNSVMETRYRKLSLQLFGEPSRTTLKSFQGPYVNLSRNLNKSAVNVARASTKVIQLTERNDVSLEERCLICYSQLNGALETEQTDDLKLNKSWDDLNEFLEILQEPVAEKSLNDNLSVFNLAVSKLRRQRTVPCLCSTCNATCGKLINVHRQMKILEQEVKQFQTKFLNAIKLSKAISEKEAMEEDIATSTSSQLNEIVDQLRTWLIGGNEKWEGIKDTWLNYVNLENEISANHVLAPCKVSLDEDIIKVEGQLSIGSLEGEINCGGDDDDAHAFFDNDNLSNLGDNVKQTGNRIVKYKTRKRKNGYSMKPDAIRWRSLRAKYGHLTDKQMKAYLKSLPKIERKGKPAPKLAIEDLKQSKANAGHIKWRKTFGRTMSLTAYREMRRKELREVQKVKSDKKGDEMVPRRGNIGAGGLKIKWEEKGDGKLVYNGVEIRKNEDGTFSCVLCETNGFAKERVKTRARISIHINRMHFASTDGHACTKCNAKFYYYNQLTEHIRGKHEGFQCEICGQSFPYPSSLFFHKRVKHQGIKPHVCEHCGKGFATKKDMTVHVRRHTGERPFVCHVCAKTFIEKQSMKKHIKKLHPGESLDEPVQQNIKISI